METLRVLSLVVQSILMTTALNNDKLPLFGPRMCECLCQRTVGCSSFQYSTQHLSCKLQSDLTTRLDDSFQNFTIKEDKKADKAANLSCPTSSKIFFSHGKILQCRDNTPVLPSELHPAGGRQSYKLLLYRQYSDLIVTEISLSDYTFHTLHYKFDSRIYSLIYVSSLRSFLIITKGDGGLFMYDISKEKKSERIDKAVCDACVAKDTIFYLKPKRLMRMTLSGTDKVSITRFNFYCFYIKVDITKSNLYIFSHDEIKRVSYKGKVLWTSSVKFVTMCLGQNGDFLYITNKCTIFKLFFSNKISSFATCNVTSKIASMCVLGNQLYAVTLDCHVLSFGTNGSQEMKTIRHRITKGRCFGRLKIDD